eukprot:SAG31_NODE_3169_length_4591_cov_7.118655_8_plen_61_part_00
MFLIGLSPTEIPIKNYFVRRYSYVCTHTSVYQYTLPEYLGTGLYRALPGSTWQFRVPVTI